MNTKNLKKIITHSGNFHTDEVFACAVLSILNDGNIEVVRTRDPKIFEQGDYVVDVGGVYNIALNRFDHHQAGGAGARENGIPYSSIGLVWKEYGETLTKSSYAARVIDERIIQPIDAGDNGVETFTVTHPGAAPYLLQDIIGAFRPAWNEERTEDEGFFEAVSMAEKILAREILRSRAEESGKLRAEDAYRNVEDKRIIVLDGHYPWYDALGQHPEPLYVVKPDRGDEGKWKIETVRDDVYSFKNRKDLPLQWAGKVGEDLAQITGVPDALFCHNKRFIAVAGSKEGALALAKIAVDTK